MTDTQIDQFNTVLTLEDDYVTAAPPPGAPAGAAQEADVQRLKLLLRPVILEILRDELDLDLRMGG